MIVHRRRPAMATLFEVWLVGENADHLAAVADAVLDEVTRVESLLSRFDPAAEVTRVNAGAGRKPVIVDVELFDVLIDCQHWCERTRGYFDVRAGSGEPGLTFPDAIELDAARRSVRFRDPSVRLDFGGYGKGYALDSAARILDRFGVTSALMHGGTSSVLARGTSPSGAPWSIEVRGTAVALCDEACSISAAFSSPDEGSDIIDPTIRASITADLGCCVVAESATEAEVWSTALVATGRGTAGRFADEINSCRVIWFDRNS